VAPVAAGYKALDPCPADERASFLDIHGTADTVVPYRGAPPARAGSVPRNTARWAERDGCRVAPRSSHARRLVLRQVYRLGGRAARRGAAAGTRTAGRSKATQPAQPVTPQRDA
jgi:poly(3-hydroxybutyrate) depolymerase